MASVTQKKIKGTLGSFIYFCYGYLLFWNIIEHFLQKFKTEIFETPEWVPRDGRTGTIEFVLIQHYVMTPPFAPVIVPEQDGFQILKKLNLNPAYNATTVK